MLKSLSSSMIFDQYATRWGGVFEIEEQQFLEMTDFDLYLMHGLLTRLTQLDFENVRGEKLSLHTGIVNDIDPNAFADKGKGAHFLGVNIGNLLSAWYVSGHLVRRSDTFHLIGEQPKGTLTIPIRLDAGWEEWANFAEFVKNEEQDRIRGQAATFLRHVIVWFAALHEWGHVIGGHCDLSESRGGSARLQEVGMQEQEESESGLYYILEYLADARAMKIFTHQVAIGRDGITATGLFQLMQTDRQRLFLVGCGLMTAIWHSLNQGRFGDDGRHPRPATRFLHLIQVYRKEMTELGLPAKIAMRFVELAIADLGCAARHCPQLHVALSEAISILQSGSPWDEHYHVRAADPILGDTLDNFAFHESEVGAG